MPIWSLYIQNFIFFVCLEFINQLNKWALYLLENSNDLGGSWTSKFWELVISAFQSKLKLPLTDLYKLWATLNKCFNWGKYRIGTEIPLSSFRSINYICKFFIDLSPSFSTINSIIKIINTLLNISIKHIVNINICFTSLNNLIWNFVKQSRNAFVRFVEFGVVPNHSYSFKKLWNHLGNVLWNCNF